MKSNRIRNVLFAIFAGLLILNLGTSLLAPAYALGKTQYKAVGSEMSRKNDANAVQRVLDQMSAQGWEYVGSVDWVLIFKK